MKRFTVMIVVLLVAAGFAFSSGTTDTEGAATKTIKNPDTFVYATHGTIDSLDPAKAYDSASGNILFNLYDTLVAYNGPNLDEFVPWIAEEVPSVENGGISKDGTTYRFKIRKGVKFHSGDTLTPEDVEYTIERAMVLDPEGWVDWMWWLVFTGEFSSRDADGNLAFEFDTIDKAVEVDGDEVVCKLYKPYKPFLQILCGYWGGIVNKSFVIENGGWDGTAATWKDFNNPAEGEETLANIADGCGPYKMVRWTKGDEFVMERFDDYWGPAPAIKTGIYKVVDEWSTRKLMFIQGDADWVEVDPIHYAEMDLESGQTVFKDLPSLNNYGINMNLKVNIQDNPYVYSGKLDGNGVPSDFFADKNLRLAFVHCYDMETHLNDIMAGLAIDPVTPIPFGMPFKDESLKNFEYDPDLSTEYFKKAWDGKVWEVGFKLDLLYNQGNETRETGMKMLAENISAINPKFKVQARGVEWAEYVNANSQRLMPIFFIGWGPDYPDPDNYVVPYMHSTGTYAGKASYNNPEVDALITKGAYATSDAERKECYYRLQEIWLEDAIGIMTHQPLARRYFKDWVQGYYHNAIRQDSIDLLRYLKKEY